MTEEIWFGRVKFEVLEKRTRFIEDLREIESMDHARAADLIDVMGQALKIGWPEVRLRSDGKYSVSGRPTGDPSGSVVLITGSGRKITVAAYAWGLRRAALLVNRAIVELVMVT